jgi:YfiH family protein
VGGDSVIRARNGVDLSTWPVLDRHPVDVVVSTRRGGVSSGPYASLNVGLHVGDEPEAVLKNRRRLAAALGLTLGDLVFCHQTHGRGVAVATRDDAGKGSLSQGDALYGVDALVTGEAGLGLVMMAADCSPIALYDPGAEVVACVHSGWRGTVARVSEAALDVMVTLGADPGRVIAAIGPTIPGDRYQVGPEVAEAASAALGDLRGVAVPDGQGRWLLDLVAANRRILVAAGVSPDRIHTSALSTSDFLYFSDRAERPCGRQAMVAVLHTGSQPSGTSGRTGGTSLQPWT